MNSENRIKDQMLINNNLNKTETKNELRKILIQSKQIKKFVNNQVKTAKYNMYIKINYIIE